MLREINRKQRWTTCSWELMCCFFLLRFEFIPVDYPTISIYGELYLPLAFLGSLFQCKVNFTSFCNQKAISKSNSDLYEHCHIWKDTKVILDMRTEKYSNNEVLTSYYFSIENIIWIIHIHYNSIHDFWNPEWDIPVSLIV